MRAPVAKFADKPDDSSMSEFGDPPPPVGLPSAAPPHATVPSAAPLHATVPSAAPPHGTVPSAAPPHGTLPSEGEPSVAPPLSDAAAAATRATSRRENVAFVRSPTALLPSIEFGPTARTKVFWRRGPLSNAPGRWIILAITVLFSLPVAWQAVFGFGPDVVEQQRVAVLDEAPVAIIVRDGEVHLDGVVSSAEMRRDVEARVAAALGGTAPVVSNLRIDESLTVDLSLPTPLLLGETVQFATGRSEVVNRYEPLISTAATILVEDADVTITLIGHTDSVGADVNNDGLSLRRASAVRAALLARGVAADQATAVGRGESEPLAGNDTPEGRAINRRVEFEISGLLR